MNLSLLDPFAVAKEYPETLTKTLSVGHSSYIKFNDRGDYIASGLIDGTVVIIDCDTSGLIKVLRDHVRPISSISWSRCGRYILTSSRDWKVNLWDLKSGRVIRSVRFEGPLWGVDMNPENVFQFVGSLFEDTPVFVDMTEGVKVQKLTNVEEQKSWTLVSAFHPGGKFIFTGTSKGWLNVFHTESLKLVNSVKVANVNIKNICFPRMGNKMAINSSDRVIRQYALPDLYGDNVEDMWDEFSLVHKYQDVVNRLQWNSVCFNYNGDYVIASTYGSAHDVYMWETSLGSLIKILEGPKEELIQVDWNYRKCMVGASGLDTSTIYFWTVVIPQKWSALAPDFVEIEENIEYDEREDEFDVIPDAQLTKQLDEEEDNVVDVVTRESTDARGFKMGDGFVISCEMQQEEET